MTEKEEKEIGRSKSPYLFFYVFIALIILFMIGYYYFQNAHLFGEELILSYEDTSLPTITLATTPPSKSPEAFQDESATPTITNTPHPPTPTLIPQCGADQAVVYFLLIAKDYEVNNNEQLNPEDYRVGFADAIRLVRVDFRDATISMVSIPRDLMVAVPGLQAEGIYEARLNIVYAYGNEYDVPGGGASLLAQALYTNFGFQVDHYVVLNFWSFILGVESIGGIDIEIPENVGPYTSGAKHMNGFQALEYARLRSFAGEDTSDASRRERQTQVLLAIQKKVFSGETLPKIPQLLSHLLQAVKTDLTSEQISEYVCLAEKITRVENAELNSDYYLLEIDAGGRERLSPDYIAIREFVQDFQGP